jgi:hypothetical protein
MSPKRQPLTRKKRIAFRLIVLLIPVVTIAFLYLGYTAYRTNSIYQYVKSNQRGWRGKLFKPDRELGFAPIPGAQGSEVFPIGEDIPARFDADGFRVPVDELRAPAVRQHPIVLTLGCSFTYGAAARAEDTYPYLLAQNFGGSPRNAAVSSYGLSQMLMLAQRLTPAQKPDYLVVQYSPWLVERAQTPFAPTYFGRLPTPYFYSDKSDVALQAPVFQTKIFDLPIDQYRRTDYSPGRGGRISFLWQVGLPLFIHDDFYTGVYAVNRLLGRVSAPALDQNQIIRYVYGEIGRVARANGARLIIVILGNDVNPVPLQSSWFPQDAIIVNAQDALIGRLPSATEESYEKSYGFWRGSPPAIVDKHPNETAHRVIADAITREIFASRAKDETTPTP